MSTLILIWLHIEWVVAGVCASVCGGGGLMHDLYIFTV